MVLQNETADAGDDLEHFEDILEEEEDNKGIRKPDKKDDKDPIAQTSNGSHSDSDSSLDENGSEEDSYDNEEDDLLGQGGLDKPNKFKSTFNFEVHNLRSTNGGVALPGGYNPRHREPTFW